MKLLNKKILLLLFAGLIFRISLSFFGTLELDFNTFVAWSDRLVKLPFYQFYDAWSDYLPGYLYILFALGKLSQVLNFVPQTLIYKLPSILADIASAYFIFVIVAKQVKGNKALIAASLYLFNPAVFANSTLWGQADSLTSLFSLASVFFAGTNFVLSAIFLGLGTLIKPQAALSFFAILFVLTKNGINLKKLFFYAFISLAFFAIPFVPFSQNSNIIGFIIERFGNTLNQYPYTSVNAFSFWGLSGFWKQESNYPISPSAVGYLLTIISSLVVMFYARKKKYGEYLVLATSFLFGFMFFSRMHERHLFPVFAPITIASSYYPVLMVFLTTLSISYLSNLYYSYVWITKNFKEVLDDFSIKLLIITNLTSLFFLIREVVRKKQTKINSYLLRFVNNIKQAENKKTDNFEKFTIAYKTRNVLLSLIIIFTLTSRVIYLNEPDHEYFDEVYHAFTARVMKNNDPKAWEWWNPHPEGFAYEWTHPPVAKLGMWLGMSVFGENSFGWRIPGALLGTASVYLVYLISKILFKDELLSLVSSALLSVDGLILVISRIGMNDAYLLFFVLLSFYMYLKDKNFLSSVFFGLAMASKWSAVWGVPIFITTHFLLSKKIKLNYLFFLVIPPLIYVASYLPMFTTGHNFDIFIGVQKQMWWYHTGLVATHPFTSKWYTWPFLIRPIWLFTQTNGELIRNIYAMGNPIIFWSGAISIAVSVYYFVVTKSRKLLLVIFSYLIFFVPWALSPRIMFLYHYLPSVPFMAIATSYVLRKQNTKMTIGLLVIAFLAFVYFFPHFTGMQIPKSLDDTYYWFKSWR